MSLFQILRDSDKLIQFANLDKKITITHLIFYELLSDMTGTQLIMLFHALSLDRDLALSLNTNILGLS